MRALLTAAFVIIIATASSVSEQLDYVEAYHSCDETAAVDYGFVDASLPQGEISGRRVQQAAGQWKGQELIVLTVPTSTGIVFCMTTLDYRVVQYKFNGRVVILRD